MVLNVKKKFVQAKQSSGGRYSRLPDERTRLLVDEVPLSENEIVHKRRLTGELFDGCRRAGDSVKRTTRKEILADLHG